jgi:hypothetical protein
MGRADERRLAFEHLLLASIAARVALLFALVWLPGCAGEVAVSHGTEGNQAAASVPAADGSCAAPAELCGSVCVDTTRSPSHCGGCGLSCAPNVACENSRCAMACPTGQEACGATCVDTSRDGAHCGMCANACTDGRLCVDSACRCPQGELFCAGRCVDIAESSEHCGQCDAACESGRSCVLGRCGCDSGKEFCGGACVDPLTTNEHCGGCGTLCDGGQSCRQGRCECPEGQEYCNGVCLDTRASDLHCGACDSPCALGRSCVAGSCTGGGGSGADGCMGLATEIKVDAVFAYQSIKTVLMQEGFEVPPAQRSTQVVAGRETLIRVLVAPGPGFSARELSARLLLTNGTQTESFYQKRMIAGQSAENSPDTTFQLFVPADRVTPESRFYVELAECSMTSSGELLSPRYPAGEAEAELGAKVTGGLKLRIVPVEANGRLPDTSAEALEIYRAQLLAMYPVDGVTFSVGAKLTTGYPIDWSLLLDQVRARRQAESAPADVYYYGLVKPEDTFKDFCGSSCTTGVGYVSVGNQAVTRAATGIGFADAPSAQTLAHELGHNHGRNHSPCVSNGSISGVDPNYPYENGIAGVWGYDSRARVLFGPTSRTDIMGYCANKWLSDYTYNGLMDRVTAVNLPRSVTVEAAALSSWLVLLVDPSGPRWGIPITQPSLPSGEPVLAESLDEQGRSLGPLGAYATEIADLEAFSIQLEVPPARAHFVRIAGWPALRLTGAHP